MSEDKTQAGPSGGDAGGAVETMLAPLPAGVPDTPGARAELQAYVDAARQPRVRVAFYESVADVEPLVTDLTWPELTTALTSFAAPRCAAADAASGLPPCAGRGCSAKRTRAWSPVDIEGPRGDANVRAVTMLVLDLDGVSDVEAVVARVAGVAGVLHTTHSHGSGAGEGSYRLALRLSRPVEPREWPAARRALLTKLGLDEDADPRAGDLARIYFVPTRREGAPSDARVLPGEPADVDAALGVVAKRRGRPPKPPREETWTAQGEIPAAWEGAVKAAAADDDRSVSRYVRELIRRDLEARGRLPQAEAPAEAQQASGTAA